MVLKGGVLKMETLTCLVESCWLIPNIFRMTLNFAVSLFLEPSWTHARILKSSYKIHPILIRFIQSKPSFPSSLSVHQLPSCDFAHWTIVAVIFGCQDLKFVTSPQPKQVQLRKDKSTFEFFLPVWINYAHAAGQQTWQSVLMKQVKIIAKMAFDVADEEEATCAAMVLTCFNSFSDVPEGVGWRGEVKDGMRGSKNYAEKKECNESMREISSIPLSVSKVKFPPKKTQKKHALSLQPDQNQQLPVPNSYLSKRFPGDFGGLPQVDQSDDRRDDETGCFKECCHRHLRSPLQLLAYLPMAGGYSGQAPKDGGDQVDGLCKGREQQVGLVFFFCCRCYLSFLVIFLKHGVFCQCVVVFHHN